MADHYSDGTYRWWHLSRPSPELVSALEDGWLSGTGRAVDVGCGLGREPWQIEYMQRAAVPSDTRTLDVLVVRLSTRTPGHREPEDYR